MGACYFIFFFFFGITVAYLSPLLLEMGYSKQQVGLITGSLYLCNTLIPLWGGRVSDKYLSADQTIRAGAFFMCIFSLMLWWQSSQPSLLFLAFLLVLTAARAPMIPLQDTLAMQVAGNNPSIYARMRALGSLGFAVAVTAFGYLADAWGIRIFYLVTFASSALFLLQSFFIPKEIRIPHPQAPAHFWKSLSGFWWIWLLAMTCYWICFGPYHYGFTLLLEEQGAATYLTGWFWAVGVAAEIGVFLSSGWFFARWNQRTLMFVAFYSSLLRWILVAFYPTLPVIALSQVLHGPGFALFYAAAMQTIRQYSGGRNQASFQGLFSTCVGGLGSILGTLMAGWLHETMPFRQLILWFLPINLAAIFLLILTPPATKRDSEKLDPYK